MIGADMFMINNKNLLYIVDYFSKFPVVRKMESMLAKDLIQAVKVVFTQFGLLRKLVSDAGTIFMFQRNIKNLQMFKHRPGCDIIISPPEQWTDGDIHKVCETHQEVQTYL